jgi:hypothetical protein
VGQGFFWLVLRQFSVGCAFQNAHLLLSDFADIRSTRPHTHACVCVCVGGGGGLASSRSNLLGAWQHRAGRHGARMTPQAPEQGIPASAGFVWPVCADARLISSHSDLPGAWQPRRSRSGARCKFQAQEKGIAASFY